MTLHDSALAVFSEALTLSEKGGWLRPFIEVGQQIKGVISRVDCQSRHSEHLRLIKAAIASYTERGQVLPRMKSSFEILAQDGARDVLTRREYDLLALLVQRLQTKEMAAQLSVSPETVKTHLKHLYQKLNVTNRREVSAIAAEILQANQSSS